MVGRWLLKTEPEKWSWDHQEANGGISQWDGVRNAQAQKHLRAMEQGDLCFFYHSGSKGKEIVGIVRVSKPFYPDPSDASGKNGMVDVEAVFKFSQPVSLIRLKQEDGLSNCVMFRQPRLSVLPVTSSEWGLICKLTGDTEASAVSANSQLGFSLDNALDSEKGAQLLTSKTHLPHEDCDIEISGIDQSADCNETSNNGTAEAVGTVGQSSSSRKRSQKLGDVDKCVHVLRSTSNARGSQLPDKLAEISAFKGGIVTIRDFSPAKSITTKAGKGGSNKRRVYSKKSRKEEDAGSHNGTGLLSADEGRMYRRRSR